MASAPLRIEVSIAEMPKIQNMFIAMAELARGVDSMTLAELEQLPTHLLKPLERVLKIGKDIDHTQLSAQEGALRQELASLIAHAGAGTVEIRDLRRLLQKENKA